MCPRPFLVPPPPPQRTRVNEPPPTAYVTIHGPEPTVVAKYWQEVAPSTPTLLFCCHHFKFLIYEPGPLPFIWHCLSEIMLQFLELFI